MRYVQSYNVPQQLGAGAVSVSPSYIQTYFAIGVGFDKFSRDNARHDKPKVSSGN